MDNRTTASFKRAIRDINYSLQQLNSEIFKLSLKQFSLEKTLIEKGVIDGDDTMNNLKQNVTDENHNSSTDSATLEALARLAKSSSGIKVINN
jgi:hypothetical protein